MMMTTMLVSDPRSAVSSGGVSAEGEAAEAQAGAANGGAEQQGGGAARSERTRPELRDVGDDGGAAEGPGAGEHQGAVAQQGTVALGRVLRQVRL